MYMIMRRGQNFNYLLVTIELVDHFDLTIRQCSCGYSLAHQNASATICSLLRIVITRKGTAHALIPDDVDLIYQQQGMCPS